MINRTIAALVALNGVVLFVAVLFSLFGHTIGLFTAFLASVFCFVVVLFGVMEFNNHA